MNDFYSKGWIFCVVQYFRWGRTGDLPTQFIFLRYFFGAQIRRLIRPIWRPGSAPLNPMSLSLFTRYLLRNSAPAVRMLYWIDNGAFEWMSFFKIYLFADHKFVCNFSMKSLQLSFIFFLPLTALPSPIFSKHEIFDFFCLIHENHFAFLESAESVAHLAYSRTWVHMHPGTEVSANGFIFFDASSTSQISEGAVSICWRVSSSLGEGSLHAALNAPVPPIMLRTDRPQSYKIRCLWILPYVFIHTHIHFAHKQHSLFRLSLFSLFLFPPFLPWVHISHPGATGSVAWPRILIYPSPERGAMFAPVPPKNNIVIFSSSSERTPTSQYENESWPQELIKKLSPGEVQVRIEVSIFFIAPLRAQRKGISVREGKGTGKVDLEKHAAKWGRRAHWFRGSSVIVMRDSRATWKRGRSCPGPFLRPRAPAPVGGGVLIPEAKPPK